MSGIRVGLLGPFELTVGGRPVLLRSPKYRAVLATLLVEPGRQVPASNLIESVWGADLPHDPRGALHICLSRVRSTLVDAGVRNLIVSAADGYVADVECDVVDVTLFRQCIRAADVAAERSDPAAECRALSEALDLWRGDPLVDIPSDYLQRRYALRLGEERLQAAERRIQRRLEAGSEAVVIGELTELTAQFPLRERMWAQLMTALYRTGRRSDALNAYHTLRRRLTNELGVEPGEEIQRLHTRILIGPAGGAGRPDARVVPRQLPLDVAGFAGRAPELMRMGRLLAEYYRGNRRGPTILLLTGMAGVGKTALAVHLARRVADRFPDGQLWLGLRGYDSHEPLPPRQAISTLLRALDVSLRDARADLDSQIALFRSATDGRRMLLVLDNARSAEQVLPLLPGDARTLVIVTSRNDLAGLVATHGAHVVDLQPFTAEEAREMLRLRLGTARLRNEDSAVGDIIGECAGLPLALAILAARAAARSRFPLHVIHRQLTESGTTILDRFAIGAGTPDVRAVLAWSYHSLSDPGARLFRLLGSCPAAEISTAAAASLAGVGHREVQPLLDELVAAHLATEDVPGRYRLHDLLRAYAAELAHVCDRSVA